MLVNAEHVSHAKLKALRQADTLPLARLCQQVRQENYQEWHRWEQTRDWRQVLSRQYGLFRDAPMAPAPYTDLPLFHVQEPMTMDLLKISVSKDAVIRRDALLAHLHETRHALLPLSRAAADNVRLALTYRLRPYRRFADGLDTCQAIATPTRGAKGLDIWVHVQRATRDSVEYSPEPIMRITGDGGKNPVEVTVSTIGLEKYSELVRAIGSAESLQEFGAEHFFEPDIRTLSKKLLEDACLPLWPGIMLCLTGEGHAQVQSVQAILGALDGGQARVSLMSLDNTPANREALARELAETFVPQLEKLTERLGYPAPNVEAVQAEYDALLQKLALAETVLGVEIDCLDAQVAVEMALGAAQAA